MSRGKSNHSDLTNGELNTPAQVTHVGEQTPVEPFREGPIASEADANKDLDAAMKEAGFKKLEEIEAAPPRRLEEWHATVTGDVLAWILFCEEKGWKPMLIELNNGELQLMCTAKEDPRLVLDDLTEVHAFKLIRVKHEVAELREGEKALYYESHVKLEGVYRPDRKGASRDLLRSTHSPGGTRGRWYMTVRAGVPVRIDPSTASSLAKQSVVVGVESEAVLLDTNRELDKLWGIE